MTNTVRYRIENDYTLKEIQTAIRIRKENIKENYDRLLELKEELQKRLIK